MSDFTASTGRGDENAMSRAAATMQKWGAIAAFLLAVTFVVAPSIYLFQDAHAQQWGYDLADFLYGPVWGASLVVVVFALRERIGELAPRRMTLSLLAALLAAGAMITVACIRSANRHYHLMHPELNLEMSSTVLIVWTTLVAGVTAAGVHFTGWSFLLLGWAGWSTHRLPRLLSALYVSVGVTSLFDYVLPYEDMAAVPLAIVASIWLGILFWKDGPRNAASEKLASQPGPS